MRLFEIYQEEKSSTFVHDGKTYDINKLFKLADHIKPELYRVSDLIWVLNYDMPEAGSDDDININIPILITMWYDDSVKAWRHTTIDGMHRLDKARRGKVSHLPGRMIPADLLNMCEIK